VISALTARISATPRGCAAVLAGVGAAGALLALAPGDLAGVASRATLVGSAIGIAGFVLRRRARSAAPPAPLQVVTRETLAPGAGLALIEVDGRRLLVGFGRDGAALVADLGSHAGQETP
jgi:flagellar protein FliO/FliZ